MKPQPIAIEAIEASETAQLKFIKDNPQGLMMLDRELAGRAANVPTDFSKGIESAMAASGT